ncbi:MAG: ATP-binding protein [Pyrinomonadaceae bacterium]
MTSRLKRLLFYFLLCLASSVPLLILIFQQGVISGFVVVLSMLIAVSSALLLESLSRSKTRGIERVTRDLNALAKGELGGPIELRSGDEARALADDLNVLKQRMRVQLAREAESRQFDSFVRLSAMLTHDLKNAIEALSLIVSNMERHFHNEQFRKDAMRSLTTATNKLKALVARLSNPVNTLSGEHKKPQTVDLIPILSRVVSTTAQPLSEQHQIIMKTPVGVSALVDAERIEKVIENLVLNALEAMADRKGVLTIEAGVTETGAATFSVSDTGRGMSKHFVENRLFRPFATTKKNGVGLGLYTCREVVRANAGWIEAHSIEGAGATFRVVLPSGAAK